MTQRKWTQVRCQIVCIVISSHPALAAQKGKRVVVIGSSFISMELVVAISKRELASIDVIGLEEFPFQAVLGKEIGASLKKVPPLFYTFNGRYMIILLVSRISRRQIPYVK